MKVVSLIKSTAVIFSLSLLFHTACRPAAYEFVNNDGETGNPETFAPNQGVPSTDNYAPTARVEAIVNGQSVTKVRAGEPVIIRPSVDTADVDDIGKSSCANPGIVRADYAFLNDSPSVDRNGDCKDLGVPHTFNQTGNVVITMVVTSDENETATAKMTLTVIGAGESMTTTDGGFNIRAYPMVATVNQSITFVGDCYTKAQRTITWNFADRTNGTGEQVTHKYTVTGPYQVEADCVSITGESYIAWVTIVITKDPITNPGGNTPPNPCPPGQVPVQDPQQVPNQGPNQDPNQGDTKPNTVIKCVNPSAPNQSGPNQQG